MTSGTRNEPPISTNSPRETTTGRPAASACKANISAAAPLLTTNPSSASPSQRSNGRSNAWREPRSPLSRSSSRLQKPAAVAAISAMASALSGARPALVINNTPLPLCSRRSCGPSTALLAAMRLWVTAASTAAASAMLPSTMAARADATASRAMVDRSATGSAEVASDECCSSWSIAGNARKSDAAVAASAGAVGLERCLCCRAIAAPLVVRPLVVRPLVVRPLQPEANAATAATRLAPAPGTTQDHRDAGSRSRWSVP